MLVPPTASTGTPASSRARTTPKVVRAPRPAAPEDHAHTSTRHQAGQPPVVGRRRLGHVVVGGVDQHQLLAGVARRHLGSEQLLLDGPEAGTVPGPGHQQQAVGLAQRLVQLVGPSSAT